MFSIEILGLVGREGAGPHDLLRLAQRGRMLAGKSRERTVYTLTDKGLEALREYAQTAVTFTPSRATRCCA